MKRRKEKSILAYCSNEAISYDAIPYNGYPQKFYHEPNHKVYKVDWNDHSNFSETILFSYVFLFHPSRIEIGGCRIQIS